MSMKVYIEINVKIPLAEKEHVLEALKELEAEVAEKGGSSWTENGKEEPRYCFVDPGFSEKTDLIEIFDEWSFKAFERGQDLVINEHSGEKIGDIEHLWDALAMMVKDHSYIIMHCEDDTKKTWIFQGGKITKVEEFSKYNEDESEEDENDSEESDEDE